MASFLFFSLARMQKNFHAPRPAWSRRGCSGPKAAQGTATRFDRSNKGATAPRAPLLILGRNQARQRRSSTSARTPQLSMDPHTRGTNPRHSAAAQGDKSDAHTRTTKLSVNTSPKVELSRAWQRVLRPQAHTQCLSTRLRRGLSQTPNATAYQGNLKELSLRHHAQSLSTRLRRGLSQS